MNGAERQVLDPRAWLIWWVAASLPALVGRNPFMLLVTVLCVLIVWISLRPTFASPNASRGLVKLFVVLMMIGVLFNLLTVRAGDIVLLTISDEFPFIGGELTLNAVVYGALGGIAILILVIAGLTVAASLEWAAVMRLMPDAFLGIGVAGSIAFTFFPQMLASFRDIREARQVRGAPLRSPLDYASIASPILASGLDRAVTLSELLETRAFGSSVDDADEGRWRGPAIAILLTTLCTAVYMFAVGRIELMIALLLVALATSALLIRTAKHSERRRTRYRVAQWTRSDTFVSAAALAAIAAVVAALYWAPEAVRYEPYPTLDWPLVNLPLLIALTGLAAPALVGGQQRGEV